MPSNYDGFLVTAETVAGVQTSVGAGVDVAVWSETAEADVAESPLTTDADGEIAAGTLAAVAVGTVVHFRVENYNGMAFSVSQVTT
jgi:hypothetical protein